MNMIKDEKSREILQKYLEKEDAIDYLAFAGRLDSSSRNIDNWVKVAQRVLSEEEYKRFYYRVFPLEVESQETEEMKDKLISLARRITMGKANMYDVFDEVDISMEKYMYLLKQLTYRYKILNASCYKGNAEYFSIIDGYAKSNVLTSSFPTLGKEMHNKLVEFVAKYDLPLNNYTYTEAYKTFKLRGIISYPKVK